jgi:hypothetical protein
MPVRLPVSKTSRHSAQWDGPRIAITAAGTLMITAFAVAVWALPSNLVLPAFSLATIPLASAMALLAWARPHRARFEGVTYWDAAGALALIGAGAAMLGDPMQVASLLEVRSQ